MILAAELNALAGGAVVAPWEVRDLPEDWLDVARYARSEMQAARSGARRVDDAKARYFSGLRS